MGNHILNLLRKAKLSAWAVINLPRRLFVADTDYVIPGWDWRVALLARVETTKINDGRLWYEPDEHDRFAGMVKKGENFLDVGMNIGFYCFLASHYGAKKVVGIEIIKSYADFAEKWLKKNGIDAVVLNCAVGSGEKIKFTDSVEKGEAAVRTLDSIAEEFGYPGAMKMDIEGWEYDALNGAGKILERKPAIDISIHPAFLEKLGRTKDGVFAVLRANGYAVTSDFGETYFLK